MSVILLVEDDPNQRLLYEEELRSAGYDVVTASDGHEAVQRVEDSPPDLVVMDISMPGMDGIEAMSRMLAKDHKLPVIFNTAYAAYRHDFRTWSANAYVMKSSDLTELTHAVERVLNSHVSSA